MNDILDYRYMPLARYVSTYIVSFLSHSLSAFGSASIIFLVLRDPRKRKEVYHRLVLGMSVVDLIFSLLDPLQGFLLPKSTSMPFAIGNSNTCDVMGLVTIVWLSTLTYNAVVCFYFLLTVEYQKRHSQVRAIIEPYGHIVAVGVPMIVGITALQAQMFNPELVFGICFMAPYPVNCLTDENMKCLRGASYTYGLIIHNGINLVVGIVGIGSTWRVYSLVKRQERINRRHSFEESKHSQLKLNRARAVATQALFYTLSFLNTMFAGVVFVVLNWYGMRHLDHLEDLGNSWTVFFFYFLFYVLAPLQGFLNWMIYIRPRWLAWRGTHAHKSRVWVYKQILAGKPTPVSRPTRYLSMVDSPTNLSFREEGDHDDDDNDHDVEHPIYAVSSTLSCPNMESGCTDLCNLT